MNNFRPSLEAEYQEDLETKKIRAAIEASLTAAVLFALFSVMDKWALPSALHYAWSIRAFIVAINVAVLLLTRYPRFLARHYAMIISLQFIFGGAGIVGMIYVSSPTDLAWDTYYVGLILVIVALYTWTYLTTLLAVTIGCLLFFSYWAQARWVQNLEHVVLLTNVFFLAGANIIGFVSKNTRERFSRDNFLLRKEQQRNLALVQDAMRQSDASEERYRILFENVQDIVYRTDLSGRMILCSPYALNLLGYTAEDALNLNIADFYVYPTEREEFLRVLRERGHFSGHEVRIKKKDGTQLWVSTNAHFYRDRDGKILGVEGISRDITERKMMEEALRASERKYRTLFETLQDVYYRTDLDGNVVMASPSVEKMLGYRRSEVEGRLNLPADIYAVPEDRHRLMAALKEQDSIENFVTQLKRSDGSVIWVSANVRLLRDESGTVLGVEGMARDITVLKEAEENLRVSTEQLEALNLVLEVRVQEETEKRIREEQLLVQQSKLAAMGEMMGVIAHQWRQPLNSIGLMIQDAAEMFRRGELDPRQADETVNAVMNQIEFMSRTIDDFRSFLRPSKEKVPFDVRAALMEVVAILSAQLENTRIQTVTSCSCPTASEKGKACANKQGCALGKLTVNGYPNEFKQSILNILSNAIDAVLDYRMQEGADRQRTGLITLRMIRQNGSVLLEIEDDGGGIKGNAHERIFEPYFTTKSDEKGTGIGLYMARKIIEDNMGGSLTAENGPQGAIFTARFPSTSSVAVEVH